MLPLVATSRNDCAVMCVCAPMRAATCGSVNPGGITIGVPRSIGGFDRMSIAAWGPMPVAIS